MGLESCPCRPAGQVALEQHLKRKDSLCLLEPPDVRSSSTVFTMGSQALAPVASPDLSHGTPHLLLLAAHFLRV
jgi:hypothetical protein